jgi:hypothetical protein
MADRRKQAIAAVDRVLVLLERQTDVDETWHEANGGWTVGTRDKWLQRFADLRTRLLADDADFEHESQHLVRELDHDGIVGGPVWDAAADLQSRLGTLDRQRSKRAADGR